MLILGDMLNLVMPDFVRLIDDFDFVQDFGAAESRKPSLEVLARPVKQVMQEPVFVEETSGLLRAFALLRQHGLHDLPVVATDGRLVGIVSRVDIGTALLVDWGTLSSHHQGIKEK
jgi:CBS domain-containing protein